MLHAPKQGYAEWLMTFGADRQGAGRASSGWELYIYSTFGSVRMIRHEDCASGYFFALFSAC